jgi:hypothetical protein
MFELVLNLRQMLPETSLGQLCLVGLQIRSILIYEVAIDPVPNSGTINAPLERFITLKCSTF